MKNVTISMPDELAQRARVAAAHAGTSVSKYIAEATRQKLEADAAGPKTARRNRQREALERVLTGPLWDVMEDGRMPTREERNARR